MRSVAKILTGVVMVLAIETPAGASDHCGASYTIRAGDSLGKVARRCGHSFETILAANPEIRNPSRISIGQRIAMPDSAHADVSDTVSVTEPLEETILKGRIFAGRWCALIETAEGEVFGLASPRHSFRSDTLVEVKGRLIGGNECGQHRTIMVSDLSNAGLKF